MNTSHDPYAAAPPPGPVATPGVIPWFIVYCVVMAMLCLFVVGMGLILLLASPADLDMDPAEARFVGTFYACLGTLAFLPFAAAPALPRRKWVWIYDIVIICFGMTSCCTLPACIPLLIFWIKPEVRQHFGWT